MPDCFIVVAGRYSGASNSAVFLFEADAEKWAAEMNVKFNADALALAKEKGWMHVNEEEYVVERCDFEPLLPSIVAKITQE